ncbi:hypothetical protein K469DRAFT_812943 [Zopfia rhizophila CBS 207.26]|uniref:BTB domain-containing protein n=1 Tax=Zopfia rhizophila CBS 207.26 TaxID=1314779 RepID=A0A6A6DAL5_9PEZI|nr:hypothetical protein K469DRAFT_812943 [Zopfia rhizophila CBS 207.26]
MSELIDNRSGTIVEIAAHGDVVLVIGPEHVKPRVYSLFLAAALKPFSTMLRPDWKEGEDMLG